MSLQKYHYMTDRRTLRLRISSCMCNSLHGVASYHFQNQPSKILLGKGVLKICNKFTGEHPCRSVISIKFQSNFIDITLRNGCSLVTLLHIFRIPFHKNTFGWLLLHFHTSDATVYRHGV